MHVNFFTNLFEIVFTLTKFINFFIYDLLNRFYIRRTFIIRFNTIFIKIFKIISTCFSIIAWFHVFLFKNKIDNQAKWINVCWKRNIVLFRRYIYKLFPISYVISLSSELSSFLGSRIVSKSEIKSKKITNN